MTHFDLIQFLGQFSLPLLVTLAAIIAAVLGVGFRESSDSPWTEWPREEER